MNCKAMKVQKMVLNDELMLRSLATDQEGQEFTIWVDNPGFE